MKKTLRKIALILLVLMLAGAITSCIEMIQMTAEIAGDVSNAVTEAKTAKSLYQTAIKNDEVDTF